MSWQKLILQLSAQLITPVTDLLEEAGALAITLEADQVEPLFEPPPGATPLWARTQMIALFAAEVDVVKIMASLSSAIYPQVISSHFIETLADQDWQKVCNDAFEPICFANRLWIYPSWHPAPADELPAVLLDPGMAFGTGTHPTTALCLEWLAQHVKKADMLIDYGCGSGILGIAALKLGAEKVWAIDNDPQALEATLENGRRNNCLSPQLHALSSARTLQAQADSLIANILANPLIELAHYFVKLVKPGGAIVLSGILQEQAALVQAAYAPWVDFSQPKTQEEWVLLHGTLRLAHSRDL